MRNILNKVHQYKKTVSYNYTKEDARNIHIIEQSLGIKFPQLYKEFIKEFGALYFLSPVMITGVQAIPNVSIENDLVPLGRFLDWSTGDFSISHIIKMYDDQFPSRFVPFAEGTSGDFIGFYFDNKGNSNISYWFHESLFTQCNKVSDNFEMFLNSLVEHEIIIKTEPNEPLGNRGPSPKMIELLKKSGKWE